MLEAKSVRKAKIPASLLQHPTPAHIQPTRLALHVRTVHLLTFQFILVIPSHLTLFLFFLQVNQHASTCSLYIASAALIYKLTVSTFSILFSFCLYSTTFLLRKGPRVTI